MITSFVDNVNKENVVYEGVIISLLTDFYKLKAFHKFYDEYRRTSEKSSSNLANNASIS